MINFLQELLSANLGYSAINTARSALSSLFSLVGNENLGSHPLVQRFVKGVFVKKPMLPRSVNIWDVSVVLDKLRIMFPLDSLSLKDLTMKTVMLMLLLTGQRGQTIHLLRIHDVQLVNDTVKIAYNYLLKTSRPSHHLASVIIDSYNLDLGLCLVHTLRHYLERTMDIRKDDSLFVGTMKPHKGVSRDTVTRWVKTIMGLCGIDTNIFKPHSTRAASASAAKKAGVPMKDILKSAGWSNAQTFYKFYSKHIDKTPSSMFSSALLDNCSVDM